VSSPYEDLRWQDLAACLGIEDPDIFFPERGGSSRAAKGVCALCPVRSACLRYSVEIREKFGIWGGTGERERRPFVKEDREASEQARRAS
jgi:WhiB family transcriptional regulator, redox-sensing transcriptional regulator